MLSITIVGALGSSRQPTTQEQLLGVICLGQNQTPTPSKGVTKQCHLPSTYLLCRDASATQRRLRHYYTNCNVVFTPHDSFPCGAGFMTNIYTCSGKHHTWTHVHTHTLVWTKRKSQGVGHHIPLPTTRSHTRLNQTQTTETWAPQPSPDQVCNPYPLPTKFVTRPMNTGIMNTISNWMQGLTGLNHYNPSVFCVTIQIKHVNRRNLLIGGNKHTFVCKTC